MGERSATARRRAAGLVAGLALVTVLTTTGCATERPAALASTQSGGGGSLAADQAEAVARQIGADMTPPVLHDREAAWLVQEDVARADDPERGIHVEALDWSGRSGEGEGARIDVRITVDVDATTAATLGESSTEAGSATRCWRYAVVGFRYYDTLGLDEIECTDEPAPAAPTAVELPALPEDAEALVTQVLTAASPESLAGDLEAAFPQDSVTTESDVDDGELVAAVGVPAERDCLVMVRDAAGTVTRQSYDPVWLEPGELGCSTMLYTSPPS